jgi:Nup85 Nucleoporin
MDPSVIEILQNPPPSPMTGTLIAPLALLFNFFQLKLQGNTSAAVRHLSKLFRLSSMPGEYISLLMAEMLPILDGNSTSNATYCEEKHMIGHKDLFEILAAVEDYVANEHTYRKGSELLSMSARLGSEETGSVFRNWRNLIRPESTSRDIMGLFRLKVTKIIAHLYTTN